MIGTSAGAISATLSADGYSSKELLDAINQKTPDGKPVFSSFMDKPKASDFSEDIINNSKTMENNSKTMEALKKIGLPFIPGAFQNKLDRFILDHLLKSHLYTRIFSFIETGGFYSGGTFLDWMGERLQQKGFASNITLLDFFNKTKKDLSLVASNVTIRRMLVLNHRTSPKLPVARAVRMSMSIPFVWQEVTWQDSWGAYKPVKESLSGAKIVDGGVLSNFPMNLIAETSDPEKIMGAKLEDSFVNAAENLGLLIDETKAVPRQPPSGHTNKLIDDLPTIGRIHNIAETKMSARDNSDIDQYHDQICFLPARGYGTLEFEMEETRRNALINAGFDTTLSHLKGRGF